MHLKRVVIKNYRSIRNQEIIFTSGKNIIIGRNNAGKSNIVKAIDIILGEGNPNYAKSENITEKDFFTFRNEKGIFETSNELYIYCELERGKEENIDYERFKGTFAKFCRNRSSIEDTDKFTAFDTSINTIHVNDRIWIDPKSTNDIVKEFNDKYFFGFAIKATRDGLFVEKDIRFFYRQDEHLNWSFCYSAPFRNEFLLSAVIPSFRDPNNQLRLNNYTWYGKLMKHMTSGADAHLLNDLQQALGSVNKVAETIFGSIKESIVNKNFNIAFPESDLLFQFNSNAVADFYKDCLLYVDDGVKTLLTEKGSGIQSAVLIGLFSYYLKEVNSKTCALLCVEEPELFLHPHARRTVSDRLDTFLEGDKNQVIVTTHSQDFIRSTNQGLNIIVAHREGQETVFNNLSVKNSKSLLLDNNVNEMFFADKVILCEGYDNYIIRWVAEMLYGSKLNEDNISIVSVGGKDNFEIFWRQLNRLNINTYIVCDFDYFIRDGQVEEAKRYDAKVHTNITSLKESFFSQKGIYGSSGPEKYKALQKIVAKVKNDNPTQFYTAKNLDELDAKDLVGPFINDLRSNGVGVLSKDIENFSVNRSIISTKNKLSIEKIFEVAKLLNSDGKKISDVLDTTELEQILTAIMNKPLRY